MTDPVQSPAALASAVARERWTTDCATTLDDILMHLAGLTRAALLVGAFLVPARFSDAQSQAQGQSDARAAMPRLHHVGLNSVDPERAIDWYLRVWPAAKRTQLAGFPAVEGEMLLLFNKVDRPPSGAWRDDLHRSEPQSAFWHIGAFTNTTELATRLSPPLFELLRQSSPT